MALPTTFQNIWRTRNGSARGELLGGAADPQGDPRLLGAVPQEALDGAGDLAEVHVGEAERHPPCPTAQGVEEVVDRAEVAARAHDVGDELALHLIERAADLVPEQVGEPRDRVERRP